jgi:hypothetical protein
MNESRWLTDCEPHPLIDWLFFDAGASDRKLRLFAVACCQPLLPHLGRFTPLATDLLALAEAFADRRARAGDMDQPRREAREQWGAYDGEVSRRYQDQQASGTEGFSLTEPEMQFWAASGPGLEAIVGSTLCAAGRDHPEQRYRRRGFYPFFAGPFPCTVAGSAADALAHLDGQGYLAAKAEAARQRLHIPRDIFGNPFRPDAVEPSWRTAAAVDLAQGIYDERAFDRLPVLADALEDAGCANPDVLGHCRGAGPHARGCGVVDAVLGKE